jgi:hypothetical protein
MAAIAAPAEAQRPAGVRVFGFRPSNGGLEVSDRRPGNDDGRRKIFFFCPIIVPSYCPQPVNRVLLAGGDGGRLWF